MVTIRVDIREDDGDSIIAEVRNAPSAQVDAARRLALDITQNIASATPAPGPTA